MSGWMGGALRSPVTLAALVADTPHSLAGAQGERWPVVDGIPFLRADRRELADLTLTLLDRGDEAAALAALLRDQDNWARTPPPDTAACLALVQERDRLSFREAMDRLAFGPVATYFAHRWTDPTYLSGLALAEAHWTRPGRVFELACGAGQFLQAFLRACPDVTGGDLVFSKLWLARHWVAPAAQLVCFDAAAPWPLADAAADLVFCHDALYFLPDKPHVAREIRRVAGRGAVLVGHAHNGLVDNLSSGAPLSPAGYADLFDRPVLYDDRELTQALVEARAPRAVTPVALAGAPAIALASRATAARPVLGGLAVPAPGTALQRNPLYQDAAIVWPSERYAAEYGPLATYPLQAEGPERAVAGEPGIEALARRRVLVELPARW